MRPSDSASAASRVREGEHVAPRDGELRPRAPPAELDLARRRVEPGSPLFRVRAVRRYARGESVAEVLDVGGSSAWVLCWCATACVVVGLIAAFFVRVEIVARARGVLRPLDEIAPVTAQTEGVVSEVHVIAGQQVGRGERLISIDAPSPSEVRAPFAGTIDSMLVRPGQHVGSASLIGRLVPTSWSERVVAFVPERERAFIRPGASVRLAIDQLPSGEFGWMTGRVAYVAMAIATPEEIRNVLGSERAWDGAHYRVDVTLVDDARWRRLAHKLPTSAMLTAHITVRTLTVAELILRPLRKGTGP